MKVACLTYFVPRKENVKGPSGLLYQTIKLRPANVHLIVFVFGQETEDFRTLSEVVELSATGVVFIRCAKASRHVRSPAFWPRGARNIAGFEMPALDSFDAVWAYPYWFAPFVRRCDKPLLISGMDCATLLYWRKFKTAALTKPASCLHTAAGLIANALFESLYLRNCDVHVVGIDDARLLGRIAARPKFIPHPFLAYARSLHAPRPADRPLTFLISNAGDPVYGSPLCLDWIQALLAATNVEPSVRLILHKAAPTTVLMITAASRSHPNLVVDEVTWVDDYAALLREVDIQLFPLEVGAGTKTSVLTALQHGIRAVCTRIAAENVQVNPYLFVAHDRQSDFPNALTKAIASVMAGDPPVYLEEKLTRHSPEACSSMFWKHFEQNANRTPHR